MSSRIAYKPVTFRRASLTGLFCELLLGVGFVWLCTLDVLRAQNSAPLPPSVAAVPSTVASPTLSEPSAGPLDGADSAKVFESVSKEVGVVFNKCKSGVVRIIASDDYGMHSGTGFFIDSNGTIYTHYAVAGRSWNLNVEFADKKYPATCLLADPRSGTALLKIQAERTPYLNIGNSAELRVASPVITVGYPMDLPASPNFGLVAGLDQKFLGRYLPTTHIRANLPVQSGELGAPVLNTRGEVVGILAFGTLSGASCEALPIQAAERVRNDYTRFGEARYGWIGVTAEPVVTGDENGEVKVTHLDEDTPAAHSGLKDGDVLVSVGGKPIKKFGDLRDASFYLTAEELVPIIVRRDEKETTFDVRAANLPGKVALEAQSRNDGGTRLSLPQPR